MKKLDIYVETSVCNFLHTKQSPEKRKATEDFFRGAENLNLCISDVVLEEIAAAPEEIKVKLLSAIREYRPCELADSERDNRRHVRAEDFDSQL